MATYTVKLRITAANINVAKRMVQQFPELAPHVEKVERGMSRADRLSEAEGLVDEAESSVEELRDEMQEWFDNLNEGLQETDQGQRVEAAQQALDEVLDALEGVDFGNVEFPGMFGS